MPSARVIIPFIGVVVGVIVWYLTKGDYTTSTWPRVYGIGTFILIFVVGSILVGVVQGMREAQAARPKPTVLPPPAPPPSGPSGTPR